MRKKVSFQPIPSTDRFAAERRRFLQDSAVLSAGAISLLAGFGVSQYAVAQSAPPAAGPGQPPGARPPPPPEPTVSQPAPLTHLKGKVAYITASSDGIGLGIARAASLAGMKVCVGYRNEERLQAALALFKKGNAGVFPVKHDVTDRAAWASVLDQIKGKYGKLHLLVNNAGVKTRA